MGGGRVNVRRLSNLPVLRSFHFVFGRSRIADPYLER